MFLIDSEAAQVDLQSQYKKVRILVQVEDAKDLGSKSVLLGSSEKVFVYKVKTEVHLF